jgi:hypothetical protein
LSTLFVSEKKCLIKICPIFDSSQSKALTKYQKILRGCSFGCKNLLIFSGVNILQKEEDFFLGIFWVLLGRIPGF